MRESPCGIEWCTICDPELAERKRKALGISTEFVGVPGTVHRSLTKYDGFYPDLRREQ